jgi:hypothetical protein
MKMHSGGFPALIGFSRLKKQYWSGKTKVADQAK